MGLPRVYVVPTFPKEPVLRHTWKEWLKFRKNSRIMSKLSCVSKFASVLKEAEPWKLKVCLVPVSIGLWCSCVHWMQTGHYHTSPPFCRNCQIHFVKPYSFRHRYFYEAFESKLAEHCGILPEAMLPLGLGIDSQAWEVSIWDKKKGFRGNGDGTEKGVDKVLYWHQAVFPFTLCCQKMADSHIQLSPSV
jgi:hypothetical protein